MFAAAMVVSILSLVGVSFALSWLFTLLVKRIAPRIGFVDRPGHRKIHHQPKPLGGGVAIFLAISLPLTAAIILANVGLIQIWRIPGEASGALADALAAGIRRQTPLAIGLLSAMGLMHVLGLWDDRKALGPFVKLVAQIAIASFLVFGFDVRLLTTLGYVPSALLSVFWIVAVTNAFNFLDNMDGLSAGVAAVCAGAFLVTALWIEQWFVAATLALLLGALLGFLCFNFSPASVFMGDAGSLLIGFLLGVLTVRTTFLRPDADWAAGWYAVLAPVVVLALPLYDLVVVSMIRLSNGRSPFVGDTNHFSHRLVARGMTRRTAVLCLYLITAATSVAAVLLPQVGSTFAAALILFQTLLVLGVVALLEQHPLPPAITKQELAAATPPPPDDGHGAGNGATPSDSLAAPFAADHPLRRDAAFPSG